MCFLYTERVSESTSVWADVLMDTDPALEPITSSLIRKKTKAVTHPSDVKGRTRIALKVSSNWSSRTFTYLSPIFLAAQYSLAELNLTHPPWALPGTITLWSFLRFLPSGDLRKTLMLFLPLCKSQKNGSNKLRKGSLHLQAGQHTAHAGQQASM